MKKVNTGALSHDIEYRVNSVIPNGGKLISYQLIPKKIEIIYEYKGEKIRTLLDNKSTDRRIFK